MRPSLRGTLLHVRRLTLPCTSSPHSPAAAVNCCHNTPFPVPTRRHSLLLPPSAAARSDLVHHLESATSKTMQAALPPSSYLRMPEPSCLNTRRAPLPATACASMWHSTSLHSEKPAPLISSRRTHAGARQLPQHNISSWQHSRHLASNPTGRSPSPPSATSEASQEPPQPPPDAAPTPDTAPPAGISEDEEAAAAAAALLAAEAEQHKQRVRDAVVAGELGFGFSAGGFLYCYHLGVLWELERLGVLRQGGGTLMAGASAGSLAIATFNSGISKADAQSALRAFAHDCRTAGTRYRLSGLLREFLHSYLPSDAHERCSGVCHVSLTRVPSMQHEAVSQFHDKSDLVEALLTSCHIPVYASGAWTTQFRGSTYVDGGITHFVPSPPSPTVVKVCCFPVSQLLATLKPTIKDIRRASSLMSIAVSPDAYEECEPSFRTLVKWALVPAEDEVLDWLMDKGRRDANAWAQSMGLTDLIAQPSAVLVP